MKNLLQNLEASNFIVNIHKNVLWADSMKFAELIKENPRAFELVKSYTGRDDDIRDLRTKFNLMFSGFYDFLLKYASDPIDVKSNSELDMMLTCNINDELLLVAFREESNVEQITSYNFASYGMLPIHFSTISLDFKNKIHILMYDRKFYFPGTSPN